MVILIFGIQSIMVLSHCSQSLRKRNRKSLERRAFTPAGIFSPWIAPVALRIQRLTYNGSSTTKRYLSTGQFSFSLPFEVFFFFFIQINRYYLQIQSESEVIQLNSRGLYTTRSSLRLQLEPLHLANEKIEIK